MARDPLDAVCHQDFRAYHDDGKRPVAVVKWIVLHDGETESAEGMARYFTLPASGGSAHLCVDAERCYRCLPNDVVPQAAPGANREGFHIEQAGYAKWSAVIWRSHLGTLQRAAYKTALHCRVFHIPVRFVKANELRRGVAGITTHAECTKAFGGTHTDPGPLWPRRLFMRLVRQYAEQLNT